MGQVPAVSQAHAKHGITGRTQRQVNGSVGLRTGMRLNVGIVGAEQLLGAIDRQLLRNIDVFTPAIITFAGIALRILVGEDAALGFQDKITDLTDRPSSSIFL